VDIRLILSDVAGKSLKPIANGSPGPSYFIGSNTSIFSIGISKFKFISRRTPRGLYAYICVYPFAYQNRLSWAFGRFAHFSFCRRLEISRDFP